MNQGRIWCVVSPNVGLPLFLGSVATLSLIVHYSVLSHTTWIQTYWNGGQKAKVSLMDTTSPLASATATKDAPAFTVTVAPVASTTAAGETAFVVKIGPSTTAVAALAPTEAAAGDRVALAEPTLK